MTPTYEDLQEQVVYLQGRLAELTGENAREPLLKVIVGVNPKHAAVLAVLLHAAPGRYVSDAAIYQAVYEHQNGDGPCATSVKVAICKLRLRLGDLRAPHGIETAYGHGYRATPELRAWLQDRLDALHAQAVAA